MEQFYLNSIWALLMRSTELLRSILHRKSPVVLNIVVFHLKREIYSLRQMAEVGSFADA